MGVKTSKIGCLFLKNDDACKSNYVNTCVHTPSQQPLTAESLSGGALVLVDGLPVSFGARASSSPPSGSVRKPKTFSHSDSRRSTGSKN